ncbi:hypothetical protein ABIE21_003279 [Conyzicola nivalis]|uniref:Uncharacterized protein n=1 Tax=Conyzicola nivalis TaxID=1477021 RepID=A0ABV2QRP1_9MICO
MKKRNTALAGLGVVATTALAVFAGSFASAAVPSAEEAAAGFLTEEEVDGAWRDITANYPEALPAGIEFPSSAPAFFQRPAGEKWMFETELIGEIAARYWRCAWLDQDIAAVSGRSSESVDLTDELATSTWQDLPDVQLDVYEYSEGISDYAAAEGLDESVAEFDLDCGIYTEEGAK